MTFSGNGSSGNSTVAAGKLEKATLIYQPQDDSKNIEFMFNPTELVFQRSIQLHESQGARTNRGYPKISFAYPNACILTISNLILDTYEQGESILSYLEQLTQTVEFVESGDAANKRPPVYIFAWGSQQYLYCFVEQISYRITRFLSAGTPVQARVDLTLKEVDDTSAQGDTSAQVDRDEDSRW